MVIASLTSAAVESPVLIESPDARSVGEAILLVLFQHGVTKNCSGCPGYSGAVTVTMTPPHGMLLLCLLCQ